MELRVSLGDAREVVVDDVECPQLAGPDGGGDLERGHGASPRMGGTLKRPASADGASRENLASVEAGALDVRSQHVHQLEGLSHGGDAVQVERVDVGEVFEHRGQLRRVPLELVGRELQAGEVGDVGDGVGRDALGHGRPC